jgi:hypothetical protein
VRGAHGKDYDGNFARHKARLAAAGLDMGCQFYSNHNLISSLKIRKPILNFLAGFSRICRRFNSEGF